MREFANGSMTMTEYLDSEDDMAWVREVHKTPPGFKIAILHHDRIELFARDHYKCQPMIILMDDVGGYTIKQVGEQPGVRAIRYDREYDAWLAESRRQQRNKDGL